MAVYYIGSQPFGYNDLSHHGILGMKWGIRRFQNPDGTLTPEGKARYHKLYGVDDHKPDFMERHFGSRAREFNGYALQDINMGIKSAQKGNSSRARKHTTRGIAFDIASNKELNALKKYQQLNDQEKKSIKGSVIASRIISDLSAVSMVAIASLNPTPVSIGAAFVGGFLAEVGGNAIIGKKIYPLYEDD